MASEVLLPKQGNSVESCIIVQWKKAEGDPVSLGEAILEVETDKATMEVESTAEGILLSRLVREGDDVPVLSAVAVVGQPGEKVESAAGAKSPAPSPGPAVQPEPGAVPAANEPNLAASKPAPAPPKGRAGRIAISPRARKLAETRGADFSGIAGSGPGGRIMVKDIERVLAEGRLTSPSPVAGQPVRAAEAVASFAGAVEQIPVKGIRKIIAERMQTSLLSTAQLTMDSSADARRLLDLRRRFKSSDRPELQAVSINDIVMFAVSRTLVRFTEMNATFSDGVIQRYGSVDLGFAVDTERGLMVPVIRNAESLSLIQLTAEGHRLASACKEAKATPDDLAGGTFTVTNLGVFGIESFTPVLNAPQVGILGVGSTTLRPVQKDGDVEFVPMLGLSLTINHQVVDGAPGARFLQNVARAIEEIDITLAQ